MKDIPMKNYIKAFLIIVVTICAVVYFKTIYKNQLDYEKSQNVTMSFLTTVDSLNIENYLVENHDAIMYVSNSSSNEIKEYEVALKNLIIEKELEKNIIYFDVDNLDENYLKEFLNKYALDELKDISIVLPNLFVFKDGKIVNILYKNETNLNEKEIITFIESVLEND